MVEYGKINNQEGKGMGGNNVSEKTWLHAKYTGIKWESATCGPIVTWEVTNDKDVAINIKEEELVASRMEVIDINFANHCDNVLI